MTPHRGPARVPRFSPRPRAPEDSGHSSAVLQSYLSQDEILAARSADFDDDKRSSLTSLAKEIVISRGLPSEASVQGVLASGWTQAHLIELIGLVTLNTLTNYTNHIAGTEIDFPAAPALQGA